jgi:hypothetical protein
MCNPGYIAQNGACVPVSVNNQFICASYSLLALNPITNELVTSSGANIPAQDPSGIGVCYYYPIYNGVELTGLSTLTGTAAADHDQDVISRDHDVNATNPDYVWHPYSMNHTNVSFTVMGNRTLNITGGSLNGNTFTTGTINIDNFFLVGVYPTGAALSQSNLLSYYSAWGTGDSTIELSSGTLTNGIAFNPSGIDLLTNATNVYPDGSNGFYSNNGLVTSSVYSVIPLNVEAPGGTANVPEVNLTNLVTSDTSTEIDFRGLDCGAARSFGDVYLLIR